MSKRVCVGILACWASVASPAFAQTVDLILPEDAPDGLRGILETASLTLSLDQQNDVDAQDYTAAARADYRRILTGLYGAGYYGGTVSITLDGREASGIAPLDAPRQISNIVVRVDPGPLFSFGTAEIGPLPDNAEIPDGFASGEPAQAAVIQEAAQSAISSWRDAGFALARPAGQNITALHPSQTLNAEVRIDPGQQLTFGTVTISGNQAVRTDRVRQIAGIPGSTEGIPNDVFSPSELNAAATRLRRTGTFSSVALIEADAAGPGGTLPIEIQVIEEAPRRIGFGAEYSTLDGATLSAFWLHRNLLGGAESFRLEGEVAGIDGQTGGVDYRLSATFGRPATIRPDIDLLANVTLLREDEPDYLLDKFSIDVGLTQYRSERLTYGAGIGFVTAREETDVRVREYTLLTLPLSGTYDQRDIPLNPTRGYYIDLDVIPFLGVDGLDNGARLYADARAYRSFGMDDRLTFAARVQLGSVVGSSLADAPADFLFYSGGGGTVRGQAYQSLGIDVTDDFGDGPVTFRSGGASFVGAQIEARYNVTDAIGVVGFYDVGMIGADSLPSADDEFHAGAGIGVRYNTGIGPIRLDIATPATGDDAGQRVEVYIGIGQSF